MKWLGAGGLLAVLVVLPAASLTGQGWVVDASAGAAEYDALAGDVGMVNAILGLRREGPTWLTLAAGVPLDSAAVPWTAAGAGTRWAGFARGVEYGLDAGVIGFGYRVGPESATGGGATLTGLPFVAYSRGRGRVEARSGVLHHTSFFDGATTSRTVHDSGLRALLGLRDGLVAAADARVVRASEGAYPYAGASLEFTQGPLMVWVRGGRWMAEELDAGDWGLGGRVALPGRLAVRAAYEREADDPLYWNGPRSSWSVGISRALGRPASFEIHLPPPDLFRTAAGTVVLRLPAGQSNSPPSVAGDFTDWQAVPMERRGEAWEASFELAPGIYHYSFRRADGSWFLPDSVQNRVDDGFGGVNAVLVVADS